ISRSSASSSAIKTTIGFLLTILASINLNGQFHNKCRSLAGRTLGRYQASVPLHNFPANRQAHACTFVFVPAMQPLKHFKNALAVCFLEPYAVIADRNLPERSCTLTVNLDNRRLLRPVELESIANQILKQLPHLQWIGIQCGKRANFNPATS